MEKVITKTAETTTNATPAPDKTPEPPKASPQTAAIINKAEAKEDTERSAVSASDKMKKNAS